MTPRINQINTDCLYEPTRLLQRQIVISDCQTNV